MTKFESMRSKADILETLKIIKQNLQEIYPISSLALFGSYARNEATEDSDVDILIEFKGKVGSRFFEIAELLEKSLQRKVDLVSKNGIVPKYLNEIKQDLIYV
ncbi:MAG: putative nucleotidyltransferase [Vicingaceae bacterium]|jgi:predicted nucleotidyltransferase